MKCLKGIMAAVLVVAISLTAGQALAWRGHHGGGNRGYGCSGYYSNISDEELNAINAERDAFYTGTEELRQSIYEKRTELRDEFALTDLDVEKIRALQTEISDLDSQFGQQRVEHMIRMHQISPDFGIGYGMGYRGMGGMGGYRGMDGYRGW